MKKLALFSICLILLLCLLGLFLLGNRHVDKPIIGSGPAYSSSEYPMSASFSPDGGKLVVRYSIASMPNSKNFRLWNMETGEMKWAVYGLPGAVTFLPDGERYLKLDQGKASLHAACDGHEIQEIGFESSILGFSRDGRLAVTGTKESASLWDVSSKKKICSLLKLESDTVLLFSDVSSDNKKVFLGVHSPSVHDGIYLTMIDLANGETLWSVKGQNLGRLDGIFSPDGKLVVSLSPIVPLEPIHYQLIVRDASNGNVVRTLKGHPSPVTSMRFTQDSRYLLSGSKDNTIKKWNMQTGKVEWSLDVPANLVAISPDASKAYATTGFNYFAGGGLSYSSLKEEIWDLKLREKLRELIIPR